MRPLPVLSAAANCSKAFTTFNNDETYLYQSGKGHTIQDVRIVKGLDNPELDSAVGEELELVKGASHEFDQELFLSGDITPVFFGTALGNFGVDHMLDGLVSRAPAPMPRVTDARTVTAQEEKFTGFVFKIQANMDPKHRGPRGLYARRVRQI